MKKRIEQHYIDKRKRLVILLSNRAGGRQNAEDIIQNAFELAIRYRHSYNIGLQTFEVWFNTILNNALRKFKTEEKRMGMSVEYNEDMDESCPMLEWEEDMINLIKWEVNKKKLPMRQALYLYLFRGYKPREVAQIVDMSNAYIRTSVKEFKQEMRKKYGDII
jgi:DNA-directed RNA polymerase specialized sigma24 family protein